MIRLILIDVDGTLVGTHGVHPSTWPALALAKACGVHLGLCTGRIGCGQTIDYARAVSTRGLHIFQSGAVISRPGEPAVYTSVLPREALAALVQISRREGQPLEAYTERGCYLEAETDLTRAHAAHLGLTPTIGDLLQIAEPVVSAVWVVAEPDWSRFRRLTTAVEGIAIGTATTPWSPGTIFANLTCAGTAKSSALRWLAERYAVGVDAVAMVGDGENDLDAMQAAGLSIALGNAPEAVKGRAQRVVSGVDDGGLAEAIYVALRHDRRG